MIPTHECALFSDMCGSAECGGVQSVHGPQPVATNMYGWWTHLFCEGMTSVADLRAALPSNIYVLRR